MRFLRRSMVGLFLMSLTLGLLAYAGISFYGALSAAWNAEDRARPARERVFAVNVVAFEPTDVTPVMTSFGEVLSRRTFEVRATASGTVTAIHEMFEDGGVIGSGDLLVQIDPTIAESALQVARTDVAEAEAELRDATRALDLAKDDLAAAEEQAALRTQALARQTDLNSRGIGTEASVETAALNESSAKQAVLSKRQALAAAEARLDQGENALSRAQIALGEAERALLDTQIHAAFSGTLSDVTIVEGRLVQNNEQIANLIDPNALEVAFRVSTSEYARLLDEDGRLMPASVAITLDVLGADLVTEGVITRESASVGAGQTGRVIFARIDAPRGFRPGDFVTVEVEEPPVSGVAFLPSAALDAANTILLLTKDERLESVTVDLVRRQGDMVIVRGAGLEGRLVVAERSPLLGEGIKVRPIAPPDPEGTAPPEPEPPAMVELDEERRARLVAFVEGNQRMPAEVKQRVLAQLSEPMVPAQVVERIESRMGG